MNIRFIHIILLMFLLTSCFKEDDPVAPVPPGNVTTTKIEMMNDYRYQIYYSLSEDMVVSQNWKKSWDLAFETGPEEYMIRLNTSNFMLAANTGIKDFESVTDTTGADWKYDKSDGDPDSTALLDWVEVSLAGESLIYSEFVYILNRGLDELGNELGIRKVVFNEVTDTSYSFRYAMLDGSEESTFTIRKDPAVNHVHFTFDDGGAELVQEPQKDAWDIIFTQYTTLLYTDIGQPYPYLVTGAMINPEGVLVARDTSANFADIDLAYIDNVNFREDWDYIGYDWKDVVGDLGSGSVSYQIVEGLNYLIQDRYGFYYKLRFISFYNNSGDKGYPTFEFQRL